MDTIIKIENLTFCYAQDENQETKAALKNISLEIEKFCSQMLTIIVEHLSTKRGEYSLFQGILMNQLHRLLHLYSTDHRRH